VTPRLGWLRNAGITLRALAAPWSANTMGGLSFAVFMVQPSIVEVDGDTGTSRSYVEEVLEAGGKSFMVYGVYNDEVIRENGAWRFKARHYNVLYNGPVDLAGEKTGYRG
jgi:hypothetical protein